MAAKFIITFISVIINLNIFIIINIFVMVVGRVISECGVSLSLLRAAVLSLATEVEAKQL